VDLSNVEDVILSHNHWDHVTGLVTLLTIVSAGFRRFPPGSIS
jgi:metal-dependent hydrolase (beta-lactamase superfamily II)